MDGLEAIEINLSTCKNIIDFRIDANTYKKEYVEDEKLLRKIGSKSIQSQMISIQNFGAYSLCSNIVFCNSGIPFLMTQNIRHNFIDWNGIRYVDKASHSMLHKSHCSKDQVLVTMAGEYLGRVAVYDKDFICSSNQAIAKITLKDASKAYYVATFLNTKYGQNQINRFKTITGQPNINMSLIQSLLIPSVSSTFNNRIQSDIAYACELLDKATVCEKEAEELISTVLKLKDFNESKEVASIRTLSSSFGVSGRLDAEYYQEKYDEYEKLIRSTGSFTQINEAFGINKTKPNFMEDVYNYTEIGDIDIGNGVVSTNKVEVDDLPANAKILANYGDILVSKVRPNRGAVAIVDKKIVNHIVSNAFTVLYEKSNYKKEVLKVLLRTDLYKSWLLKYNVGTSYPVIKDDDILNLIIPVFNTDIQDMIIEYERKGNQLITQADKIFSNTSKAVEIATSDDEKNAFEFLKE